MKTVKIWSSLSKELKAFLLDFINNQEPTLIEEYDELSSDEINELYLDIGGEG